MLTPDDPFYSSKFGLLWAEQHLLAVVREARSFFDSNAYEIVAELDEDGTNKLVKFRLTEPMPVALNGHTLDVVYNLRAALDQATNAVALLNGTLPKEGGVFFPIRTTIPDFNNALNGIKKWLPQEILDLVSTFQPYKGGNDLIWALNKLCNAQKHGIIRPLPMGTAIGKVESVNTKGRGARVWMNPKWDRVKNEMILMWAPVEDEFTVNFNYDFSIVFDEIEGISGKPIITVLDQFLGIVKGIVTALEAESIRLGLV